MSVVYFTDRDLGLQFPKILHDAGLSVERHRDHFAPDAPDEQWLAFVGRKGWVALTHNSRIRYTPNEKEAVISHGVRLLVIIGHAPYPELANSSSLRGCASKPSLKNTRRPSSRRSIARLRRSWRRALRRPAPSCSG